MVAPLFQHLKSIQVELIFRGLRDFNFSLPCKQEKLKGESTNQPARPRPQKGIAFPLSLPVSPHSRSSCASPLFLPLVSVRVRQMRASEELLRSAPGCYWNTDFQLHIIVIIIVLRLCPPPSLPLDQAVLQSAGFHSAVRPP